MKVFAINSFFIPKTNFSNRTNKFYLDRDIVSFAGKTDINEEMKSLPSEAFPSVGLRKFMLQSLEESPNANVVELHREYYADLLSCETLAEAKECYPEFEKVLDAKDINLSKKPPNNIFCQISNGNIKDFDIDSVSLMMLKKYYGELIPINADKIKEKFGIAYTSFHTLLDTLNISMDKRYFRLLGLRMRSVNMQGAWETDSMLVKRAETLRKTLSTPEYKQKASIAAKKKWEDTEYRQHLTAKIGETRRSPEARAKTAEITRQLWQDEEYQKKMKINNHAAAMAWNMHPFAKDVYKEIAHEFPELKSAFESRRKGLPITDRQSKIISLYYKTCAERYPNLKKEVGELQKQLLQQWGFYDSNRNIDDILAYISTIEV